MRFTENRKIAWCALVLCIFVSVFLLGGMKLSRERSQAVDMFNNGSDTNLSIRHSMDAYLDASADAANLMASEGELHKVDALITESVRSLSAQIGEGEDIGMRYAAYTELKTKVDQLYNKVYDAVGEKEFAEFKIAYDDFWGYEDMISRDDYHKTARDFNKLIGGFPGAIIAGIMGLNALNTFGG